MKSGLTPKSIKARSGFFRIKKISGTRFSLKFIEKKTVSVKRKFLNA